MVVAAPLSEELVMRGVVLRGLLQNYSRRRAIAIGAILFALSHINPMQFATALILGVLLGWWFSELQSIWLGFVAHALNNTLPFLALLALSKVRRTTPTHVPWTFEVGMVTLGAVLLVVGVQGCRKVFRERRAVQTELAVDVTGLETPGPAVTPPF
jgi:uncharacterized protein